MAALDRPLQRPRPRPLAARLAQAGATATGASAEPRERWLAALSPILTVAAVFLVVAHTVFARAAFEPLSRFLLAVPGLFLLAEIYRYANNPGDRELPVNVIGLLYYYIAFSFPAFFEVVFYDVNGPFSFTSRAYTYAAMAVALGVMFLYAGMRLGEIVGVRARPALAALSPPIDLTPSFAGATYAYSLLCVGLTMIFVSAPTLIPGEIGVFVNLTISFDFAIGLVLAKAEHFRGRWSKYTGLFLLLLGGVGGIIRGVLDPAMRLGVATITGRWANTRKIAVRLIAGILAVYVLFQPIKHDFRDAIWRNRDAAQVSYADRVDAWVNAFTGFWTRDDVRTQDEAADSTIGRLSELDAVMHVMDMVPVRVQPLEGAGWIKILTAPIPRIIWRDKPTTSALLEQRYAVVFKRQTEMGARGTAILLPLLVDGYWNFQWIGVPVACLLMGFWIGLCQKTFAGEHWALRAMGVAHLARLVAQGPVGGVYSGIFQHVTGLILASWLVYGIERLLSRPGPPKPLPPSPFALEMAARREARASGGKVTH
ncbi:MAG: hypothetical protein U0359_26895 [Byssovorax sp.]